jgi:hypothetical protein
MITGTGRENAHTAADCGVSCVSSLKEHQPVSNQTQTAATRAVYEERPGPDDGLARALWDVFSTVKRLDRLEMFNGIWVASHSTGTLSFYDPDDGEFDNGFYVLRLNESQQECPT